MRMVPLGELADINPRTASLHGDEAISFVGMAELDDRTGVAVPREARAFSEVAKGYTVFNDGDILAAKITPCWENGKIGVAQLDHPVGVGSTEFHVVRARPAIDKRYLLHFLRQDSVRNAGELRMTGSGGQRRVPRQFLESLAVPVPDMAEQQRIAAILSQADSVRGRAAQSLLRLNEYVKSIFQRDFSGLPATTTLGEHAVIQGGLQVSSKRASLPSRVPYLRVANVHRGYLKLDEVKSLQATEAEIERTRLECGDLLFVEGHANPLEVGRVGLWEADIELCVHQNHLIRARTHADLRPEFAAAWFNSQRGAMHFQRAGRTTSGLNTISAATVRSAPLPLPPMGEQIRFAEMLRDVSVDRATQERRALRFDALFASLQSRAFRGEL